MVYRLVGFIEYGKAVEFLDEFLKKAEPGEIEIAEQIVREQNQFAIYTNLSRTMQGQTQFSEQPRMAGDRFRRHGLAWMMALARVELGAMLAGFTSHPRPFHAVKPSKYEADAFRNLLLDGYRSHYWALKRDPVVSAYYKLGIPENHIITYGRRATVARHFLRAVRDGSYQEFSGRQLAELSVHESDLRRLQLAYLYCLSKKNSTIENETVTEKLKVCPSLLSAVYSEKTASRSRAAGTPLPDILLQLEPTLIAIPCR